MIAPPKAAKAKKAPKSKSAKGGKGKGKGKGKGGKGGKGATLASHPKAHAQIRAAKGWGGLGGFAIAAYLSYRAQVPFDQLGLRAIACGIAGYLVAWAFMITRVALPAARRAPGTRRAPARSHGRRRIGEPHRPGTGPAGRGNAARRWVVRMNARLQSGVLDRAVCADDHSEGPWIPSTPSSRYHPTSRRSPKHRGWESSTAINAASLVTRPKSAQPNPRTSLRSASTDDEHPADGEPGPHIDVRA